MANRGLIFFIFALCAAGALFLSFAYPAYDAQNICQHSADYFLRENKPRMETVFQVSVRDFSLTERFFNLFPEYRMNCDATSFLFLGRTWPQSYYERNLYIDHPLYHFFAFLIIKPFTFFAGVPSYAAVFSIFILVNYVLLITAAWFLYDFIRRLFSPPVGFLSGLFLIFSPFVHSMLAQPTSASTMELFVVSLGTWLICRYAQAPTPRRLIIYSLIFGILMLGKQVVALGFFVLLLALYYKRYREGMFFFVLHAAPTALWYAIVRFGFGLPYYLINISVHGQGVWLLRPESWQGYRMVSEALVALPHFFSNAVYGFLLLPILCAAYGLYLLIKNNDQKFFWACLFSFSFFLLFFGMHLFRPSLSFLLFPVIYPCAAFALLRLPRMALYPAVVAIVAVSQINFHLVTIPGVSW